MSVRGVDPLQAKLIAIEARIRAGDSAGAAAALERVRAQAPGDVRICLMQAALARAVNDAWREIAALERGVGLTPNWPVVHVELSKAFARERKFEEALAAVAKAVELAPRDLAVLETAVAVANQAGAYGIAERHLRAASALQPDNPAILRSLAACLGKLRRFAEAEPLYRRLLAAKPDIV